MKDPAIVRCADLRHGVTQVCWDGHTWTAWAQAPEPGTWWLYREGAPFAAVRCQDMTYPHEQLELNDEGNTP